MSKHGIAIIRACRCAGVSGGVWYRGGRRTGHRRDEAVIEALNAVVSRWPRWGFWKCFRWVRGQGHGWNPKRVWRIYCQMKLNVPRRKKKVLRKREKTPLGVSPRANESWALDFMHDALFSGQRFRTLNVLDEGVRECLGIETDTSLPSRRVVRVLDQIASWRGWPRQLRVDNGPELIAAPLEQWCAHHRVNLVHIESGKPNQNAYIERFNRSYRYEVLSAHLFRSLDDVRELSWQWMNDYNEERPHDGLKGMTPTAFRLQTEANLSSFELFS